jgi:hypothetical protein
MQTVHSVPLDIGLRMRCDMKLNTSVEITSNPDNIKAIILLAVFDVWKDIFLEFQGTRIVF